MNPVDEGPRPCAGSRYHIEVGQYPRDVLASQDVAVEDELTQPAFEQGGPFCRPTALAVLGVAAEDRPAITSGFEHPNLVFNGLAYFDAVVLGDRDDAHACGTETVGEGLAAEIPIDEKVGSSRASSGGFGVNTQHAQKIVARDTELFGQILDVGTCLECCEDCLQANPSPGEDGQTEGA